MSDARPQVTPFLMFEGRAEEAMNRYVELFDDSAIESITRYGTGEPGPEGTVLHATFALGGRRFFCIDSPARHEFTFTPAVSLFVECGSAEQVDRYFQALAEDGAVLMPLGEYPFSPRFGWVQDRFGVSWQVSFATVV